MKQIVLVCATILLVSTGRAQDWRTLPPGDTVYFGGFDPGVLQPGNLRVIWVTHTEQVGTDTLFQFYRTVREPGEHYCLDTLAPSWLGPGYIRTQSGTEYYFNSNTDTIKIFTQANLNDRWIMALGTDSTEFEATIVSIEPGVIDGQPDSIKTARIQAYKNGATVSNLYNDRILQWSRNHGWIQTVDLYRFPNDLSSYVPVYHAGVWPDKRQYTRMPASFGDADIGYEDRLRKYQPGNEWIIRSSFYYKQKGPFFNVIHDSVTSLLYAGPEKIIVGIWRKADRTIVSDGSQPFQIDVRYESENRELIDTIKFQSGSGAPRLLRHTIFPEIPFPDGSLTNVRYLYKYPIDTFCGSYTINIVSGSHTYAYYLDPDSLCWRNLDLSPGSSWSSSKEILIGFGWLASSSSSFNGWNSSTTNSSRTTYLKLGDCIFGKKATVNIADPESAYVEPVRLYPNPASGQLTLELHREGDVRILDLAGRTVWKSYISAGAHRIDIQHFAPGIYLMLIANDNIAPVTQKLIVQ
jgi:hypothetical protein